MKIEIIGLKERRSDKADKVRKILDGLPDGKLYVTEKICEMSSVSAPYIRDLAKKKLKEYVYHDGCYLWGNKKTIKYFSQQMEKENGV